MLFWFVENHSLADTEGTPPPPRMSSGCSALAITQDEPQHSRLAISPRRHRPVVAWAAAAVVLEDLRWSVRLSHLMPRSTHITKPQGLKESYCCMMSIYCGKQAPQDRIRKPKVTIRTIDTND